MGFFADAGPVQGIYVNKHVSGGRRIMADQSIKGCVD